MKNLLKLLPLLAFTFVTSCKDKPADENTSAAPSADPVENAKEAAEDFANNPEAAANKIASIQEKMAEVMESVTDAESGEAAIGKLEPIIAEFQAFGKVMEGKDEDLSPELEAKLEGIVAGSQKRVEEAMKTAMPVFMANPELAQKFQAVMSKMAE